VHVLFRLNFLGFCTCVLLNNEYMLYYICAMHTLFTLFVMAALYIKQNSNGSRPVIYAKIFALGVFTTVLYDGPATIFNGVFGTLPVIRPLMAFHDPLHPEFTNEMHEWHFRSGLDRFIWIVGMIFALHLSDLRGMLERLEAQSGAKRVAIYMVVVMLASLASVVWWYNVFQLDKFEYNKLHPFTSWAPITLYLLFRNLFPALRRRYLYLFAFMGKYTLETYIFQFHIWMRTTGLNGSPKHLLEWIPGWYWANFALTTVVYVFLSIRFFNLTSAIGEVVVRKSPREQAISGACVAAGCVVCWVFSTFFSRGS